MADNIPWFKSIQSIGRGFRPGMEIHTVTAGKNTGKTVIFDIESDDFKPWRETFRPHYAEYRDFDTGETYWKKFNRLPRSSDLYRADNVIRLNEDGTYEYVKNRKDGNLRQLTEEEIMWVLLRV
jgi:hypothetical protein